ncbi:MAG: PAS domain S-box protein, partial [Deltaproteobacteria bacterium]|nr:PAS domain S-box protein [Deltaproteobacteria bacterium]
QGLTEAIKLRLDRMLEVTDFMVVNAYDRSGNLLVSRGLYPPDSPELSEAEISALADNNNFRHEEWHGQYTIIYTREIQVIGERIGFVRVYSTMEGVKKDLRVSYMILGAMLASILITMLVLLNLFLSRTIIRPITSLSHAMELMQAGNIRQHYYSKGNDEIGDLSGAFNRMSQALSESYRELDAQRIELQGTRNFLSNIIDSMPSMLVGIDTDMKITKWNMQAERHTGISAEDAIGEPLVEAFPQITSEIDRIKTAMTDRTAKKDENVTLEVHGEKTFMDVTVYPLTANGIDGAVIRIDDVTERKKIEDALMESEEKYRLVVDHANDAIVVLQDGRIKFANPRTAEAAGYSIDEMKMMHFIDLIMEEDKEITLRNYTARTEGKEAPSSYIFRIRNKRGQIIWVDAHIVMITWEGRPATLNFMRDITHQKKTEDQLQQAQKMEAVGTLAGGIAHDFNNLLQAIQGYTQLLLMDETKSSASSHELQEILGAAKRGGELTRQLLTFSRKVESNMRPVNINNEIIRVKNLLSRTIPKMIEIRLDLAEDLYTVNADPGQIEQVLMNLAVNARDAMKEGGKITIETENVFLDKEYCETHLIEKEGEYVLMSVTDTGYGMDKDTVEHIFEPFFTTKKVGEGTGLGLAMVYGIIMKHKGVINCYSAQGKGATFKIYLPAIASFKETVVAEEIAAPKRGTETILLVDDEEALRDIGSQLLERFGYKVITAQSGENALDVYRNDQKRIDLVILDLIMPGIGGSKCMEEILKINPSAKVVIASGYYLNDGKGTTSKTGAKGFIKKPYILESMLNEIRKVLEEG